MPDSKIQWIIHRDLNWYKNFNKFDVDSFVSELVTKNFDLTDEKEDWEPQYHNAFLDLFNVYSDNDTTIINIHSCNVVFKEAYIFVKDGQYHMDDILRSTPFDLQETYDCSHDRKPCRICDISFKSIKFVPKTVKDKLLIPGEYPKKIFLSRRAANKRYINDMNRKMQSASDEEKEFMLRESSQRVIRFNDEIEEIFKNKGYEIIDFDGKAFSDQLNFVAHAEYIAGFTGTNLINIIFANKDTKVIELQTNNFSMQYEDYARLMGIRYSYINFVDLDLADIKNILTG